MKHTFVTKISSTDFITSQLTSIFVCYFCYCCCCFVLFLLLLFFCLLFFCFFGLFVCWLFCVFVSVFSYNYYLDNDYMIPVCRNEILTRPAGTDFTLQLHGEVKFRNRKTGQFSARYLFRFVYNFF